jgi:hypothetical protein
MHKWLLIVIVSLTTIAFESCDMEDKHVHVCEGNYGSEQVIDSLELRYVLKNAFVFLQWYTENPARQYPSCDTIELRVQADSLPFRYNDTFALSVAKIFFNDSMNKKVKCLKVSVGDFWPAIGKAEVTFEVGRDDLQKDYLANELVDTTDIEFSIEQETPYTASSARENWKGMKIIVDARKDYKNIEKLAGKLKVQYDSIIKVNELTQFDIDIKIQSPRDKLCTSKTYYFFYHKNNKNI